MGGKKNSKRELIDTGRDKRFVRRSSIDRRVIREENFP